MSKFKVGDPVRVTVEGLWFDRPGVVAAIQPAWQYPVFVDLDGGGQVAFTEHELILADAVERDGLGYASEAAGGMPAAPFDNSPLNTRARTLRTAEDLINGDRAAAYGEPQENFGRVADLWNAQFGRKLKEPFQSGDVALALVHLKLSRLANTPDHEDSFVDACGYLALGAEIAEGL